MELFVRQLGYDPILHEQGSVPYGSDESLEEYCYREIAATDILVAIVGGRLGTTSQDGLYSITQKEIKAAHERKLPVFTFVERAVHAEYRTYQINKDNSDIYYSSVDDIRVFRFLDELYSMSHNNAVFPFETVGEITTILKAQWAGLFQRNLQWASRQHEVSLARELAKSASMMKQTVDYITREREGQEDFVRNFIMINHPIFHELKKATNTSYRLFFMSSDEISEWLKARGFKELHENGDFLIAMERRSSQDIHKIFVSSRVFDDDGKVIPMSFNEWSEDFLISDYSLVKKTSTGYDELDDDIPF